MIPTHSHSYPSKTNPTPQKTQSPLWLLSGSNIPIRHVALMNGRPGPGSIGEKYNAGVFRLLTEWRAGEALYGSVFSLDVIRAGVASTLQKFYKNVQCVEMELVPTRQPTEDFILTENVATDITVSTNSEFQNTDAADDDVGTATLGVVDEAAPTSAVAVAAAVAVDEVNIVAPQVVDNAAPAGTSTSTATGIAAAVADDAAAFAAVAADTATTPVDTNEPAVEKAESDSNTAYLAGDTGSGDTGTGDTDTEERLQSRNTTDPPELLQKEHLGMERTGSRREEEGEEEKKSVAGQESDSKEKTLDSEETSVGEVQKKQYDVLGKGFFESKQKGSLEDKERAQSDNEDDIENEKDDGQNKKRRCEGANHDFEEGRTNNEETTAVQQGTGGAMGEDVHNVKGFQDADGQQQRVTQRCNINIVVTQQPLLHEAILHNVSQDQNVKPMRDTVDEIKTIDSSEMHTPSRSDQMEHPCSVPNCRDATLLHHEEPAFTDSHTLVSTAFEEPDTDMVTTKSLLQSPNDPKTAAQLGDSTATISRPSGSAIDCQPTANAANTSPKAVASDSKQAPATSNDPGFILVSRAPNQPSGPEYRLNITIGKPAGLCMCYFICSRSNFCFTRTALIPLNSLVTGARAIRLEPYSEYSLDLRFHQFTPEVCVGY